MPDKTLPLILAALGALAVLAAALFIDVQRAARRGPRWRRRLLTAGLALLAAIGIGPGAAWAASADGTRLVAARLSLAATPEWKRIQAVWTDAVEVASGKRGSFPFDRAGKDKLLADLDAARKAVDALRAAGHLTAAEAGLLASDLDRLAEKVSGLRPTELKRATCYKPVMYRGGSDTLAFFEGRLPLLEKMAAGPVKPAVAKKVLERFEQDVVFLSDEDKTRDLTPEKRKQAKKLVERARRTMRRVRRALEAGAQPAREPKKPKKSMPTCYDVMMLSPTEGPGQPERIARRRAAAERAIAARRLAPAAEAKLVASLATDMLLLPAIVAAGAGLAKTEEWTRTMRTWAEASAVAQGKRGSYPFDRAGKKALLADLAKAERDLKALGETGKLSDAETGLLLYALSDLVAGVQAKRTTDMRAATCYGPTPYSAGRDALGRLEARLPLVEKLAGAAKVDPGVVAKILDRIQVDVETLADRNSSRDLEGDDRKKARRLAKRGAALVEKLRARRERTRPSPGRKSCYMPVDFD